MESDREEENVILSTIPHNRENICEDNGVEFLSDLCHAD